MGEKEKLQGGAGLGHKGPIPLPYSAYLICRNGTATLRSAAESVLAQSVPPAEVVLVDDGSTDGSAESVAGLPIRLIRHGSNLGRGAARARAMEECRHGLVLSCDSAIELAPGYVEALLHWFSDAKVGAVYGRLTQLPPAGVAERWRGRHLLRFTQVRSPKRPMPLATGAAIVRASAVRQAGGFDLRLRMKEDGDLGRRLMALGWETVCDPGTTACCIGRNTVAQVLERYWRWRLGGQSRAWRPYGRRVWLSIRRMAVADLREGDPWAVPISLAAPHYEFWRSKLGRR